MAISKLILNGETQMDVTSNTNTSNNMLNGVVGTKNDGTSVTGNIASKSSTDLTVSGATVTAPAGYYANAASKAVATTTHPNPSASIASATGVVTASHIQGTGYVTGGTTTGTLNLTTQAGKTVTPTETAQTAVASYRWTTGPISVAAISSTYVGTGVAKKSSADLTASGSTVTAPAGYYSTAATKNISAGSAFPPAVTITKAPTIGVNTSGVVTASYNGSSSITPTVTSGYVSKGTAGTISTTGTSTYQLTSKAAATYYPSTTNQTIASQRWLVGNQTIKSVTTSNLTAENIAEGVVVKVGDSSNASRITQVTGTYSGIDRPYYEAYKTIALKSGISSNNTDIVSYFNTISSIKAYQFEDIYMSGSFTFPICTSIGDGGFQHTTYNHCYFCAFDFPEVESIGLFAFKLQSRLTSINAPKATVIKTQAFMSCTSLQTINFPQVTSIGSSAFYDCQALTTVSFPEALYIYTSAFCSCNNLSSISFPKVSQIDSYAFRGCYSLTTANFPSATSIGISAFYACRNLSSISFPNTTDIDVDAFHSCSNLTTADFPSATIINDSAFYNCTSLTTINAPAVTSIGGYVFTNCSSLLSIDFPQVSIVGTQAFHSCINLSIARFSKLTSISAYAFRYCYNLLSLYLLGSSVVSLGTTALAYTPISNYTTSTGGVYGSIFVPASLYDSYLTATNWSLYSARIVSV